MDYNDINLRLKRLYQSLEQRFETDVFGSTQTKHTKEGKTFSVTISFDAKYDEHETFNRINTIISNLANLKDHLRARLKAQGGDPKRIEDEINESPPLQLVLDLSNQEKHGYPLKTRRSKKDPKIINVSKGISAKPGVRATGIITDPITGASHSNNMVVVITAEVVDGQGKYICSLNDLVDRSLAAWEAVIAKYNLE